jgi:hypothetical protein
MQKIIEFVNWFTGSEYALDCGQAGGNFGSPHARCLPIRPPAAHLHQTVPVPPKAEPEKGNVRPAMFDFKSLELAAEQQKVIDLAG